MSQPEDEDHDVYDMPENCVVCDRCDGDGTVNCYCAGDFCCCGANDDLTCPVCHGETWITKELYEKRAATHRDIMKAIWKDPA